MRLGYPEEAASLFLRAYAHNDEKETVRCYLLALKLLGDEERYIKEAMRLFDSGDMLKELEDEIDNVLERFEHSGGLDCVERLKALAEDNRPGEFDRLTHEIIGELKASYRSELESDE
jgi:phosphoenolpyruvate synthase/pyruvate phosphate dikinase